MNPRYEEQRQRLEELRQRYQLEQSQKGGVSSIVTLEPSQNGSDGYDNVGTQTSADGEGSKALQDPVIGNIQNVYAPSGFDLMGILVQVYNRPSPVINVGNIDGSVALVLCDAEQDDYPIVYCSEYFERLTGYSSEEILGRNCRFLQHPPKRLHRDKKQKGINDLVKAELREKIANGQEARVTLVNYRKDGTEFVNVLTTIPIWWEDENAPGTVRRYIVGFQADGAQAY